MTDPAHRNDFADLAAVARDVAARRHRDYPPLVDAGRLDPDAAACGLMLADSIAADWSTITGHPAEPETRHRAARIETLEAAHRRCLALTAQALARITDPRLRRYVTAAPRGAVHDDLARTVLRPDAAATIRPWAVARLYDEMVATLLWWERQYRFPDRLIEWSESRRRVAA